MKSIGDYAFESCSALTSVTIGNSVTTIGNLAFRECIGLTSVTIPNSVTSIGDHVFYKCSSLTSVTIGNSVTSIGFGAFSECTDLTLIRVESGNPNYDSRNDCNAVIEKSSNALIVGCKNTVISNSVTSIGRGAFSECRGLTSVTIPSSVKSIGDYAFERCSGLTSVIIPNSVTSIGGAAFYECSDLTSVTIPNSVTSIGSGAFNECRGLTSITIPNSVTSIGSGAFDGMDIPVVISLIENPYRINGKSSVYRIFSQNTFNNATLYVPVGTIDKYKETAGWQDFVFIEEGIGNSIASVRAQAVLIQNNGSTLEISGADAGTAISVYDTVGRLVGAEKASAGTTSVGTSLSSGEIGIVKIGEKSVKVLIK